MSSGDFGAFSVDTTGASSSAESRAIRGEELWIEGAFGRSSIPGVAVTERSSLRLSAILAATIVLSTDVAVLPRKVYRRLPGGGRDRVREHPVADVWGVTPDGETTPLNWVQSWMGHALLWGTGLAEIVRNGRGQGARLHLMDPEITRRERRGGRVWYTQPGREAIPGEDVLRLAGFGHDGLGGYNLVRLTEAAIALGLAAQGFAADYFANGAEAGLVLEFPGAVNEKMMKNLREGWEGRHAGYGNRHRPAILEEGAKASTLGGEPGKSQLIETRKFQVVDATRPWRVPPNKLGDLSEAHYANVEASNLDYYQTALLQWLQAIEQECYLKLFTPAERRAGYYLEHDVNQFLRGDIKTRFESYSKALDKGWMSVDEVRERENMNPVGEAGGGRKHLVQLARTTLDRVGEEPTAAAATTPATGDAGDELVDQVVDGQGGDGKAGDGTTGEGEGASE